MEQEEPLYIAGGNVKWCSHLLWQFYKPKTENCYYEQAWHGNTHIYSQYSGVTEY
jgi:hypothetical protein